MHAALAAGHRTGSYSRVIEVCAHWALMTVAEEVRSLRPTCVRFLVHVNPLHRQAQIRIRRTADCVRDTP